MENVIHLNLISFRSIVACLDDCSLLNRPYVIAGRIGAQDVAQDVSAAALKEGIYSGMPLAAAGRLVKNLTIVHSDPASCFRVNTEIENVISRYAPVWQNDGNGNIYLDISGTQRLFGPASELACRIQNEILDKINIEAAAAAGANKLVCKVASRAIRPEGFIEVRPGEEAVFLSHQDITLLPGLGPSLMKTIRVTGFTGIGELAALSDNEALSLFGKKGILLRDSARGIDNSHVAAGKRSFESRADFPEDVTDETVLKGALTSLAEHSGLEMRRDKLGATEISLKIFYADGVIAEGKEKTRCLFILDRDIAAAAQRIYQKAVVRRISIRSASLFLGGLIPLGFEPDLFEPETEIKNRKLQEAADKIRNRYGTGKITRGIVLAASSGNKTLSAINFPKRIEACAF